MKTRPWGALEKIIVAAAALPLIASGLFVSVLYNTALLADENKPQSASNIAEVSKSDVVGKIKSDISSTNIVETSTNSTNAEVVVLKAPPDLGALNLKPELEEIVKMAQSGIDEEVLKQYVVQSKYSYKDLTSQDIITLNDLGVPSSVISEMLKKAGKPELEQQVEQQKMVVSSTNEVITATAEKQMVGAVGSEQKAEQTITNQTAQQVAAPAPPVYVQTVTQTVYVPVQTEQQQPVVVQQQLPQTVVVYYSALSPYGSWLYVDGLGYCWQPLVAVTYPGWRPYYHGGRWVWTDYGWYWLSDYSWGWATFHYGRWHYLTHHGWVWFPDTVWGPGWVSWRVSPYYCGWAPLPPAAYYHAGIGFVYHGSHVSVGFEFGLSDWHYTFIDWRYFHHRYPYRYGLPGDRAREVYNNSTVINNYITGNNNNVVINTGVGTEHIARITREEVRKVTVRDAPIVSGNRTAIYPERLVKDGNNIVLYRPDPKQTPTLAKVNSQQITPKFVPVGKLQGTGAGKPVQPSKPEQTISANEKFAPPVVSSKVDVKSVGTKSALPVVSSTPRQISPQPTTASKGGEILGTQRPILNENKNVISQPKGTQITPIAPVREKPTPINVTPSVPSQSVQPAQPPKSAQPIQPTPTPSKPILPAPRTASPGLAVARTEPVKEAQPLITHLWSETSGASKTGGSKPDPILSRPNYSSPVINPVINSARPAPAITPQQSEPPLGNRYRSPSLSPSPSIPVNPHLAPGSLDSLNSAGRQSPARFNESSAMIAPPAPTQIQPSPAPIQRTTPEFSTSRGIKVTPLPQANSAPPIKYERAPTYTPPPSTSSRITPLPAQTPSYTPTPSRIESPKSTVYSTPQPSSGAPSRSYSSPPSMPAPVNTAPTPSRGFNEYGRGR
jgi:hypothetical protein